MKCAECNKTIAETFLKKIVGTYVGRGKQRKPLCNACQRAKAKA